jgi:hypothetical protein
LKFEINGEDVEIEIKKFKHLKSSTWYILKGDLGVVTAEYLTIADKPFFNLNYHTKKALHSHTKPSKENCEFLDCPCHCDGRYINKSIDEVDILQTLKSEYEYIQRALKVFRCPKCLSHESLSFLKKDVSKDYFCACTDCDEDFYTFEVRA